MECGSVLTDPKISICIPAYNRAKFLPSLLESIVTQGIDKDVFEIIVAEDKSLERDKIRDIISNFIKMYPKIKFLYHENLENLGYDRNIKNLINLSRGKFCFFMGNDDIMAENAMQKVSDVIDHNPNLGVIIRSYDWFDTDFQKPIQEIKYFTEDRIFQSGKEAISFAFRRSGVISGYIVNRELAQLFETSDFDGILFYQMYLTSKILKITNAYYISQILTHSRSTEVPEFGNNLVESKHFTPGKYTPAARIQMISGMLHIAKTVLLSEDPKTYYSIETDIANHIYPYIADQLDLPPLEFINFYRRLSKLGLGRYLLFHTHLAIGYLLKESNYNKMTKFVRKTLGKTLILSKVGKGKISRV
jgi:abequosyltransferase